VREMRNACKILVRNTRHFGDLGVYERIISKGISNLGCGCELDSLGWGLLAGCCGHGNESSGSVKGGEFLD
jgi:hypothetical protein